LIIYLIILLTINKPIITKAIDTVDVWPGNFHPDYGYDYKLGKDFPTEDTVKIDYPKSTILANITGELLFNITLTTLNYTDGTYPDSVKKSVSIYIPPEFIINNRVESIWTSFTNDYSPSSIYLTSAFSNDPIAPNWTILTINNLNITKTTEDVKKRVFIENKTQYIRIFNVTSPSIAGRYFFKVFININYQAYSIGANNFPTIVVKGDLNPAYVSGIVVNGEPTPPALYGMPIDDTVYPDGTVLLPTGYGGRVYAEGLTNEGGEVYGQAFFNSSSGGRFTLYGLAPATYNLTVDVAGYTPRKFLDIVTVLEGQSVENLTLPILDGVNITGIVYSKHQSNKILWGHAFNITGQPVNRTIWIDITDLDENVIASSPLRLFNKFLLDIRPRDQTNAFLDHYNFSIKREVQFDGHIPQDYANYTSGIPSGDYYIKSYVMNYAQLDVPAIHIVNRTMEVYTYVDLQRTNYFEVTVHFNNFTNFFNPSPTPIGGYLYLEVLDAADAVAGFNISYVPAGSVNHTIQVRGIDIWNRFFAGDSKKIAWTFKKDQGLLPGTYTINTIFMNQTMDFIAMNALIATSPQLRLAYPTTTSPLTEAFPVELLELTNRQTPLYFQIEVIKASIVGFCNSAIKLSFHLVIGGGINFTIYSVDWQDPSNRIDWLYPGSRLRIDIQTIEGSLIGTIYATQPDIGSRIDISTRGEISWEVGPPFLPPFASALGLNTGTYILKIYTPGYLEDPNRVSIAIPVTLSHISDIPIYLYKGSKINLNIGFRTEQNFEPINNRLCYARPINNIDATPIRVEAFDEFGEFIAANISYIDIGSTNLSINLYGFDNYYGNPRHLWTNFYDTTDANRKLDSGLDKGIYQLRISVAGYYHDEPSLISIDSIRIEDTSSIIDVERLGYLSGNITWANWLRDAYPLSWASITAYHENGVEEVYTYSLDGFYEMWLIEGRHDFGVYHPGLNPIYLPNGLDISWGACSSLIFHMDWLSSADEEAVPEFQNSLPLLAGAIILLFLVLRTRRNSKKYSVYKNSRTIQQSKKIQVYQDRSFLIRTMCSPGPL
jgi:hypothetical protein